MQVGTLDGHLTYANPACHALFGYDGAEEEMVGLPLSNFWTEETIPTWREEIIPQALEGQWQGEIAQRRRDGSTFDAHVHVFSIEGAAGEPRAIATIIRAASTRREILAGLAESAGRFGGLFEETVEGVLLIQGDRFVDCNQAAARMLGYPSQEALLDTHPHEISPEFQPDGQRSAEKEQELLQRVLEEGSQRFEWVHLKADGSEIPIEVVLTPITQDGQPLIHVDWRDISERKAAEREQQRLTAILEGTNDFVSTAAPDGHLLYLNQAARAGLGIGPDEDISRLTLADFTTAEGVEQAMREVFPAVLERGIWRGEATVLPRDGEEIPVSQVAIAHRTDDGQIRYVSTIMRDISERKAAERALAESEARFRGLFEESAEGVLLIQGDRFVDCNRAAARMLGYPSQEALLDTHPHEISPEFQPDGQRSAEKEQAVIQRAVEEGSQRFEWMHLKADGTEVPIEVVLTPITQGEQQIVHVVWRDISERKRLEREQEQVAERRARQVRLTTEIAQEIAAVPDLEELYQEVVTLVKERFDYYHAQIFSHDQDRDAMVLVEGYGEAGAQMKAADHRLPYGRGVVGTAAATGEPVLAADVTEDPNWVPHPSLPRTKGELAVPITLRDEVLGVLDVQSDTPGALTEEDQLVLRGLAGQIASAIESTRLLEEASIFRQFAETSRQGIGWVSLEGQILYANPTMWDMFGEERPEEALGTSVVRYYDPATQQRLAEESIPTTIEEGQWTGEVEITSQDGRRLHTIHSLFLIRDDDGAPRYVANVITDITAQKEAEWLMGERVKELDCLNDVGRKMEENPSIPAFLTWVAARIPPAMQYPDVCVAAIKFQGHVYGDPKALTLPCHMVGGLRIEGEMVGQIYIAYTETRDFLDEESALLGGIVRRVTGYIQTQRLIQETRARAEREQLTREITDKMRKAPDLDSLMRTTLREISSVLRTEKAFVQLEVPGEIPGNGKETERE
jgi:PAS domain S-box-containing protein